MFESKIFITNYPRISQRPSFIQIGDSRKRLDIVSGYDIKVDNQDVTLQIARDLITALLAFDKIYIEGNHIFDIIQVWGSEYIKELLRMNILCVIPDQELNPVMIREGNGEWKHGFFPYPQGNVQLEKNDDLISYNIHKWTHIENLFNRKGFKGQEARAILYLIDENSADLGDVNDIKNKINKETDRDILNPDFLNDPNFYRTRQDGKWEYNQLSRVRIQELNKSAVLAAKLNIENIKMDATINELMVRKTASAFGKSFHAGTDALIRIEQQKGFPDLGALFVDNVIGLDDILKIRDTFQGKIFRYWIEKTNYDEQLMRQEIMNSVYSVLGSKCINPIRMLVCNLLGLAGFIPGVLASAFDGYIIDKIFKGWHPNFFLDDKLKRMIDDSIRKKEWDSQREKIAATFKGVGRNNPCPCGSGKKFKYCHGKD